MVLLLGQLLIFLTLASVLTYPLVFNMRSHVLYDTLDTLLISHILNWDIHKLTTGLGGYWDMNAFYPYKTVLAYSENQTGLALLALPLMLVTRNIVFVFNFFALAGLFFSGFTAYLLVRYLVKDFAAAVIGGVVFAFSSFMLSNAIRSLLKISTFRLLVKVQSSILPNWCFSGLYSWNSWTK